MVNADFIFGGVEGGATHSNIVLMDGHGKILAVVKGLSTNHWLIGMEECMTRIKKLVDDAKREAGLSQDIVLNGLGLCLSGCEQKTTNISLEENLHKRYPNLAEVIFVASDTIGSLMSACANGGINLISGTGSNCLLMNPDGATYQSGGWGHMIGDEGSAYWIAAKTVKVIYDEEDNLIEPPYPTTTLKKLVFEHFDLNDSDIHRFGILGHCYSNFKKQYFASLAERVSQAATEGDEMALSIMKEAGYYLGRFVSSVSRNINPVLFDQSRGIEIVCSGSVFRSWDLLKTGFMEGIKPRSQKDVEIPKFTLLKLEVSSAYGAIYQASKKSGYPLPKEYEKNSSVLFSYTRDEKQMNGHSNGTRNGNGLLEKKEVFAHSINNNRVNGVSILSS
ncbi:UNVERIFIED_CONTAM: hypothetical protein RMT77_012946 [Armadillidium vulgare]